MCIGRHCSTGAGRVAIDISDPNRKDRNDVSRHIEAVAHNVMIFGRSAALISQPARSIVTHALVPVVHGSSPAPTGVRYRSRGERGPRLRYYVHGYRTRLMEVYTYFEYCNSHKVRYATNCSFLWNLAPPSYLLRLFKENFSST